MFVLGIDPGLSRCGYGVVEAPGRGRVVAVAHGVLSTPPEHDVAYRLAAMHRQLRALIAQHRPDAVVVERVFFQTNARTAMGVAQASGLALALAVDAGCAVAQYTANEVKQAVTGFGAADKATVARMVARLLALDAPPRPADAADALALALHHCATAPYRQGTAADVDPSRLHSQRIAASVGGDALAAARLRPATAVGGVRLKPAAAGARP